QPVELFNPPRTGRHYRRDDIQVARHRKINLGRDIQLFTNLVKENVTTTRGARNTVSNSTREFLLGGNSLSNLLFRNLYHVGREPRLRTPGRVDHVSSKQQYALRGRQGWRFDRSRAQHIQNRFNILL